MFDMVEVVIDSIRVSLMSTQRVVVLRQTDMERYLPIWVGPYEAEAITVALQEVEMSRPLTHDLLKNLFTAFNARVLRVEVTALKEAIFYANIIAEADGKTIKIDSRPSDAIAIAVRCHVPVLVAQAVMDEAGIVPEHDLQSDTAPSISPPQAFEDVDDVENVQGEERLDVFEDFLKKLKDDQDDEQKP